MEFLLTADEHKTAVKELFLQSREEDRFVDALEEMGLSCIEGFAERSICSSYAAVMLITPKEFAADDEFCGDFLCMENFEEFYSKWFER